MKNNIYSIIFFSSFLFLSVINSFAQIQSNCNSPTTLLNFYDHDVKDLAIKRMYDMKSPDTAKIIIPKKYIDTVWHGLSAIFNLNSSFDRDSVFNIYCVHNSLPNTSLYKQVIIGVNPSFSWTSAWASSSTTTGFAALDNLLSRHGFTLTSFSSKLNFALLSTNNDINIFSLSDSLELLMNGINYAEPNYFIGDGNKITYTKKGDSLFYDFSIGWGDCPSGCINRYVWKFCVNYSSCTVNLLSGQFFNSWSNYPLPPPLNCNLTSIDKIKEEMNVRIFPNPTTDIINLEFNELSNKTKSLKILDISGKIVLNKTLKSNENTLDISHLNNGSYIILIEGNSDFSVKPMKFIKI